MAKLAGGSLTIDRLARYVGKHGPSKVEVSLVGHSAGSIFHAALLQRLIEHRIPVSTLAFMAPALRVDDFRKLVKTHIEKGDVRDFVNFVLSDRRELDDVCAAANLDIYHKSLLYLVSRGLEQPARTRAEVPLLGMEKALNAEMVDGVTLKQWIESRGACITAPAIGGIQDRSDAKNHGDFDDDTDTMTAVMARVLRITLPDAEVKFARHAALKDEIPDPDAPAGGVTDGGGLMVTASVATDGRKTSTETAAPQEEKPDAPPQPSRLILEAEAAPVTGSPFLDALASIGWEQFNGAARRASRKAAGAPISPS